MGTGFLLSSIDEYLEMRQAQSALFMHGGGTTSSAVSAITNARTGTTYQFLCQAVYDAATGDEILVPAGTFAPNYASSPYSNYKHLDPEACGIVVPHFAAMYIGVQGNGTPWTSAAYLTIAGAGAASNGRAVFSRPYSTLA